MHENIRETLYQTALAFREENKEAFDGVAVALTSEDEILTSVELFCTPFSACLCAEVGAFFEASKKRQRITHLLCLEWDDEEGTRNIKIPCGSCLDRLLKYGDGVQIAAEMDNGEIDFFTIQDLMPANWYSMAMQEERQPTDEYKQENDEP